MSVKKVCGITAINTPNYGTVLQAYALQEAVRELGYDYTLLNYYNKEQELKFTFLGSTQYMNWKYKIAKKILYPIRRYQLNKILSFQDKYIHLSERIKGYEGLKRCSQNYDVFITGSDQVWNNQEINHFDNAYFLKFAEGKRKISYAASFGKTYPALSYADIEFYKENIPRIDFIGVREKSGAEIVDVITGCDSVWVCDPVFLIKRNRWIEISKKPAVKGYILVYLVGNAINFDVNNRIIKIAKKIAKEKGLKVIVVRIGLASILYGTLKIPTVTEWIGLIDNAELVLSNSFHGSAFASILHTPFYAFVKGDKNNKMNTRLYDMLFYFGLDDRLIDLNEEKEFLINSPDFKHSDEQIMKFRKSSLDFLSKAVEG